MRVRHVAPTAEEFDILFSNQALRGSGLENINIYKKRGGSIFGILGSAIKSAIPFLRRAILPELGGFVKNVADDVSQNANFGQSVRRNLAASARNVGRRVMRGAGRVKKRKKVTKRKKILEKIKEKQGKEKTEKVKSAAAL